ncbi:MAG: glycosyltransferase [Sporocytophaga sp.]|nr:glycosyltransferase [Sporocytophaga sp.]
MIIKNPLVSICIPLYNAAEFVSETLSNLLCQSYQNIEIIIVNDHSTDNSVEIIDIFNDDRIRIYTNPEKGGNAARNYAFLQSKGELIKFMDADDFCSEKLIEKQVEKYLKEGSVDTLIFSPVKKYYSNGRIEEMPRTIDRDYTPGIELVLNMWRGSGFNCPHCYLMSRSLVEKTGPWDNTILRNQDGYYFARVASFADLSLNVDDEYALWRQTFKGVSSNKSKDAILSHFKTLIFISEILLSYKNDEDTVQICGQKIGLFIFTHYVYIKDDLKLLQPLRNQYGFKIIYPYRKKFKILKLFFGETKALEIISKSYQ